ncbi:MAG: EamA family transporter [Burkholderiales bacterium]
MSITNVLLTILCVFGISSGQVLFKIAARSATASTDVLTMGRDLAFNPYLLTGLIVYVATTFLWIWLLRTVPLSVAYPFMALAFLFVPLMGAAFLGEPISIRTALGAALIISGIWVIAR